MRGWAQQRAIVLLVGGLGHDDLERARLEAPGAGGARCDTVALGMETYFAGGAAGDFAVGERIRSEHENRIQDLDT